MEWKFNNDRPIYLQIVDELIVKIVSNEYQPGGKIPPVRELASIIKVNPNTVQRAFSELEQLEIIVTQRTSGRFVTEDTKILAQLRKDIAYQHVNTFISNMKQLGFEDSEILEAISNYRKEDE